MPTCRFAPAAPELPAPRAASHTAPAAVLFARPPCCVSFVSLSEPGLVPGMQGRLSAEVASGAWGGASNWCLRSQCTPPAAARWDLHLWDAPGCGSGICVKGSKTQAQPVAFARNSSWRRLLAAGLGAGVDAAPVEHPHPGLPLKGRAATGWPLLVLLGVCWCRRLAGSWGVGGKVIRLHLNTRTPARRPVSWPLWHCSHAA